MKTVPTFLYFAYGSNMSLRRLQARTPSARRVGSGVVHGRRLVVDKNGQDGSAKADAEWTGDATEQLHGALYEIRLDQRPELDRAEGLGSGYEALQVEVERANEKGLHGGGTHAMAWIYVATDKRKGLLPYRWYLQHVMTGAQELDWPADQMAVLQKIPCQEDPDHERSRREIALHLPTIRGR